MLQACYCGWTGEVEDQQVVHTAVREFGLQCPRCGRLDRLDWLSERLRAEVFRIAAERQASTVYTEELLPAH